MGNNPEGLWIPQKHTCVDCYNHLISKWFVPQLGTRSTNINTKNNGKVIHVSGIVDKNNTYFEKDIFVLENRTEEYPNSTEGNYSIELVDHLGQVIKEYYFDLPFVGIAGNGDKLDTEYDIFSFKLPYPDALQDDVNALKIKYQEEVLGQQNVSEHAPFINIISPHGGEQLTIGEDYLISWDAGDLDGDELEYIISLSYDAGKNWTLLDFDINETEYILNTTTLLPSDQCQIRVTAIDGFNTATNDSEVFSLVQSTLFAYAHGPYGGMVYKPIQFNGSVSGGTPAYSWYWEFGDGSDSNKQNPICTYWSEGSYPMTLTVTDNFGYTDRVFTTVYVLNESAFHKTLLLGFITHNNESGDFMMFNSKLVFYLDLTSFQFGTYKTDEKLLISKEYLGYISPLFVIGFFNAAVISETLSSIVHPLRDRLLNRLHQN